MQVEKTTKHFAELNTVHFEYNGHEYTRVAKSNVAINDITGDEREFLDSELVIELKLVIKR